MRVLLDAGHGGESKGTLKGFLPEKELNLKVVLGVYERLRNEFDLHLTRHRDIHLSLQDRIRISYKVKPDLFLSVHHNASEEKLKSYRTELYTSWNIVSPSYDFAYMIEDEIKKVYRDREVYVYPSKFTVLRGFGKIRLLTEIFYSEEVSERDLENEVDILVNSIRKLASMDFANEPDIIRSYGKYSKPKGYLTTYFKELRKGRFKNANSDWIVVLGSGRLFWEGIELKNLLGCKLYHLGMGVQPSQYEIAYRISKRGFLKLIFLKYGKPYIRYYHTSKESEYVAKEIARVLEYPLGHSSEYICIHPDGIRIEITSDNLDVRKLYMCLSELP